jgi:hypothetical protein
VGRLSINVATSRHDSVIARALGVEFLPAILVRADRVIE